MTGSEVQRVAQEDEHDRRLALLALALSGLGVGAFVLLRLLAPAHWIGWDEAYYLAIGENLFAGRGLETAFGQFPDIHAPLWPIVLQAPATWFGVDPVGWGHLLAALCGGAVIGATAWFAWRSVRIAAPLAVASMIALPFLPDLAGWMGLDLPVALLVLLYVGLGIAAVRRGSFALGLAAGLLFATAFLIKESALPFAPVPILAGLLRQTSLASIGRAAAGIVLAAAVGTGWWFVIYGQELGVVYRLGTPAWTLVLLAAGAIVLILVGLGVDPIARRVGRPLAPGAPPWAVPLAWLGAIAWAVVLTVYFARTPNPVGSAFLDRAQVAANLAENGPGLWPVAIGLVGAVIAVVDRARPRLLAGGSDQGARSRGPLRPDDGSAVGDLLVATLCGFPFVLLVLSIGEGPRHYVAQLGFLLALGAIGWIKLVVAMLRHPTVVLLGVAGLALTAAAIVAATLLGIPLSRWILVLWAMLAAGVAGLAILARGRGGGRLPALPHPPAPAVPIGTLLVVTMAISVVAMASALPRAPSSLDLTRATAVETASAWVRDHLPPGSTVAVSGFSMETALALVGDYDLVQVTDETGIHPDPSAPIGLRSLDGTKPADWLALWTSRRDEAALEGYRSGPVLDIFRRIGPAVWIQTEQHGEGAPSPLLDALGHARGLEVLTRWTWPLGAGVVETVVYRVDPARLAFADDVAITPGALERMVRAMERDPAAYRQIASSLLQRVAVVPPDPGSSRLLDRLRALAAG